MFKNYTEKWPLEEHYFNAKFVKRKWGAKHPKKQVVKYSFELGSLSLIRSKDKWSSWTRSYQSWRRFDLSPGEKAETNPINIPLPFPLIMKSLGKPKGGETTIILQRLRLHSRTEIRKGWKITINCHTGESCILYLVFCIHIMNSISYIMFSVFCFLHCVSCIMFSVFCFLYSVTCILYPVFCILYPVFCILYLVLCIMYPVSCGL